MAKRKVFYSFHFDNDVMRVQQVRNIGVIEGDEPVAANAWEEVKRKGDKEIENWIDRAMTNKSCCVVLIGSQTASRPWVRTEIIKAWNAGLGVVGIHIHNLQCPRNGTCAKGANPFDEVTVKSGKVPLSQIVECHNPKAENAYNEIASNLEFWVESAIAIRKAWV